MLVCIQEIEEVSWQRTYCVDSPPGVVSIGFDDILFRKYKMEIDQSIREIDEKLVVARYL
jgi:hypothetical protein